MSGPDEGVVAQEGDPFFDEVASAVNRHYRLNEGSGPTITDYGLDGADGTVTGTPQYAQPSLSGDENSASMRFDGSGDAYVQATGTDSNEQTIQALILTVEEGDHQAAVSVGLSSSSVVYRFIGVDEDGHAYAVHFRDAFLSVVGNTFVADGRPHLITAVYDWTTADRNIKLYVDAHFDKETTYSDQARLVVGEALRVGKVADSGGTFPFNGLVSEATVDNSLWSAQRIQDGFDQLRWELPDPLEPGTLDEPSSVTEDSATLTWSGASSGVEPITEQLQSSPVGEDDWSDVAGETSSPASLTDLTTAADYRVKYTDDEETVVYSNTVTVELAGIRAKRLPPYMRSGLGLGLGF